jgi:hypothetical protein
MAAGEAMIFPFNNGLVLKSAIATGAPLAYTYLVLAKVVICSMKMVLPLPGATRSSA